MNKKILIGSIIAVVLLTLVSFSSVVGKVSLNDELVEFDVEFCGLGKKHTVSLTQEQADEVENIFDELHKEMETVESREETAELFNEAIVELDKYSLLGGLSVDQAERLVFGRYHPEPLLTSRITIPIHTPQTVDRGFTNALCLVVGQSTATFHTLFTRLISLAWAALFAVPVSVILYFVLIWTLLGFYLPPLLEMIGGFAFMFMEKSLDLFLLLLTYSSLNAWASICFGGDRGWIRTIGVIGGSTNTSGTLWGQMNSVLSFPVGDAGVIGFTGLHIKISPSELYSESFYLGSALFVSVGHNPK